MLFLFKFHLTSGRVPNVDQSLIHLAEHNQPLFCQQPFLDRLQKEIQSKIQEGGEVRSNSLPLLLYFKKELASSGKK